MFIYVFLIDSPKNTSLQVSTNPVSVGKNTVITCTTSSLTQVHYQFYLNNILLQNNTNGTHAVRDAKNYDEGVYTCSPKNIAGMGTQASLMLNVSGMQYFSLVVHKASHTSWLVCFDTLPPPPPPRPAAPNSSTITVDIIRK